MEELNLYFLSRPREILCLQELSLIAAASLLWESKEMVTAMEKLLDRHLRPHSSRLNIGEPCLEDKPVNISDTVSCIFNQAKDQISLPEVLKTEIENKVLDKRDEKFYWIQYLIRDLNLDYKAAERIYWTTDGHIDEDKIFRFFWSDRLAEEPVKWEKLDTNLTLLQYLACFFGQEEFISSHQTDYIEAIKPLEIENNDTVLTIMKSVIAYFNAHYIDFNPFLSSYYLEIVKFYIVNKSTVEMLDICKRFHFYKAFLFFWKHLDATERFDYLETQSRSQSIWRNEASIYGTKQNLKIILFLMEQMDERQRYSFILNNFTDVILIFLRNKNCKKICMPLVEHFLPIINDHEKLYLLTICADICNNSTQFDIELKIVNRLLKNGPINRTQDFQLEISYPMIFPIIESFFENFNLPVLKVIIKDETSESRKKELISYGETKYKELIGNNNFQLMDQFLDEVLSSEAEKNKFKRDYNFLGEWIAQCRFDIVDNVLIWMHGAASQEFKAPYINLFCSSTPKNFEAIEKLLIWFFDAQGPLINNCQSKLELLNEICSSLIYNSWFPKYYSFQNKVIATNISTKILIFSYFSEKEIQNFKTNVLANEERCIKFFCENQWQRYPFWERGRLSTLDDFLSFCNLPKEKIDCIKNSILNEEWRKWALKRQIRRGNTEESEGSV